MADASAIFPLLVGRYGLQGALTLLPLLSPGTSPVQKGFGAASLAGQAGRLAGYSPSIGSLTGYTGLGSGASALGSLLGAAGLGYNISNIVGNDNLSTGQKAGNAALAASDAAQLAIPFYGPIYGATLAGNALGQHLQGSGSPQLRATGRGLSQAAQPNGIGAFRDLISGNKSPAGAFKAHGGWEGAGYDMLTLFGGPVGPILKALNVKLPFLSHTPTTGTMFRDEVNRVVGSNPVLKGLNTNNYNIDPSVYNNLSPAAKEAASQLGALIAGRTQDAQKNPLAYSIQAQNMLLNQYGEKTPDILKQISAIGQQTQQAAQQAAAALNPTQQAQLSDPNSFLSKWKASNPAVFANAMTQFKPGLPNTALAPNKTQGIMGTLLAR